MAPECQPALTAAGAEVLAVGDALLGVVAGAVRVVVRVTGGRVVVTVARWVTVNVRGGFGVTWVGAAAVRRTARGVTRGATISGDLTLRRVEVGVAREVEEGRGLIEVFRKSFTAQP